MDNFYHNFDVVDYKWQKKIDRPRQSYNFWALKNRK